VSHRGRYWTRVLISSALGFLGAFLLVRALFLPKLPDFSTLALFAGILGLGLILGFQGALWTAVKPYTQLLPKVSISGGRREGDPKERPEEPKG
jgi:hypothetical protein